MIVSVNESNVSVAGLIHSVSWKESHRSFCTKDFVEMHTPERQTEYLQEKLEKGTKLFMLIKGKPVGIVSVTDNLIEDLYILPEEQNRGYGTELVNYSALKYRA